MARRANGEGTITRRKDGRYQAALYVLTPQGTRVRRFVYGRTRADVDEKLTELKEKTRKGVPAVSVRMTVGEYLDYWLAEVAPGELKPKTLESYEPYVRLHLKPALGGKKLDRLTPPDVRRFLTAKKAEKTRFGHPHSARSLQYMHAILRSALSSAEREELVSRNVARLVKAPTVEDTEVVPLTVAEAKRLLEQVRDHRLYALWIVLLTLGLRRGEAVGLRWADVDLNSGTLRTKKQIQRLRIKDPEPDGPKTKLQHVSLKTKRSKRGLTLPKLTVEALRVHRKQQLAERLDAGKDWQEHGLVFTTRKGTPIEPRNLNRTLEAVCRAAKLSPTRLHDLRHTCASLLLAAGEDPRVIMEILGHSKIGVTMDIYAHVMQQAKTNAASHMDNLFGP
jgi:integrase